MGVSKGFDWNYVWLMTSDTRGLLILTKSGLRAKERADLLSHLFLFFSAGKHVRPSAKSISVLEGFLLHLFVFKSLWKDQVRPLQYVAGIRISTIRTIWNLLETFPPSFRASATQPEKSVCARLSFQLVSKPSGSIRGKRTLTSTKSSNCPKKKRKKKKSLAFRKVDKSRCLLCMSSIFKFIW